MLDETDEIAFVMWTAETGNSSRFVWDEMPEDRRDKWLRMARVAIERINTLRAPSRTIT